MGVIKLFIMVIKMSKSKEIKKTLIRLFICLGMKSQAKNIEKNPFLSIMSIDDVTEQLKKHNVSYTINDFNLNKLKNFNLPFLIISNEIILLCRKNQNIVEVYNDELDCWLEASFDILSSDSYIISVDFIQLKKDKYKNYKTELGRHKLWFFVITLFSILITITGLSLPLYTMVVYNNVIGAHSITILPDVTIGALLVLIIYSTLKYFRAKFVNFIVNKFNRDILNITLYHLLHMPLYYLNRIGMINHMNRLNNTERIRTILIGPLGTNIMDFPFIVIILIVISLLSGWLVLVPIFMLMINYIISRIFTRYVNGALPETSTEYNNKMIEISKDISLLKFNYNIDGWLDNFHKINKENSKQNFIFAKRNGLNSTIAHSMSLLTGLFTIFVGVFLVLNQDITPGALIACLMLIWRITNPCQMILSSSLKFTMLNSSVKQFNHFMSIPTENRKNELIVPNIDIAPRVNFKQVSLRYSNAEKPILFNMDFNIKSGQATVIVGPMGSGKTSILQLITGIIENQSGLISINDINIKQYDFNVYRKWLSYSPSEPILVIGSLADNLRIIKENATDEEMILALESAGGRVLLTMCEYDINCLFFDQKQIITKNFDAAIISLARAILSDSSLVIFDDIFDNQNINVKKAFMDFLSKNKDKKTIVFCSHDSELIKSSDDIVLLDNGQVIFNGSLTEHNSDINSMMETTK